MDTITTTKLQQIEERAAALFAEHGLTGWSFGWDRAVKRRGVCSHATETITMSRKLAVLNSYEESEQTLLHEVAHALVGAGHGHDAVWLRQARALGFKGSRTSKRTTEVTPTLIGTCPNGHESKRFRRPRRATSCGRCSSRFDERYLIVWKRNPAA